MARRVGRAAEHVVLPDGRRLVAALAGRQHRVDAGEHPRAVRLQRVEGAGGGQAFQHALVDRARIDPAAKSARSVNGLSPARLDDLLDRLRADALERRQRVVDGVVARPRSRRRSD